MASGSTKLLLLSIVPLQLAPQWTGQGLSRNVSGSGHRTQTNHAAAEEQECAKPTDLRVPPHVRGNPPLTLTRMQYIQTEKHT